MITEYFVFWGIWGVIMLYFFTPFNTKPLKNKKRLSFRSAFIASLLSGIKHKKVILAFAMLSSTLVYIWHYHRQLEWYHATHGGGEMTFNPTTNAIYIIVSILLYTVILYLVSACKRAKASSYR